MYWPFHHYEIFILIPVIIFGLKFILSEIDIVTPAFLWIVFKCYVRDLIEIEPSGDL